MKIKDHEIDKKDLIIYDMVRLLTLMPAGIKQAFSLPHACITTFSLLASDLQYVTTTYLN